MTKLLTFRDMLQHFQQHTPPSIGDEDRVLATIIPSMENDFLPLSPLDCLSPIETTKVLQEFAQKVAHFVRDMAQKLRTF